MTFGERGFRAEAVRVPLTMTPDNGAGAVRLMRSNWKAHLRRNGSIADFSHGDDHGHSQ